MMGGEDSEREEGERKFEGVFEGCIFEWGVGIEECKRDESGVFEGGEEFKGEWGVEEEEVMEEEEGIESDEEYEEVMEE